MLLLPLYLLVLAGALVALNPAQLGAKVAGVLLIPLALALISRQLARSLKGEAFIDLLPQVSKLQLVSLNLAIVAILVAEGNNLVQQPELLLRLLVPVGLFYVVNFVLTYQVARWLSFSYGELACLSCTALARNSPLSLAIAASAFHHQPLIALTLVIGPLIELPVMVLIAQLLLKIRFRW